MASPSVCMTPACVRAGQALLSFMAPNYTAIDPCADWNTYACKGFSLTHTPRPDQVGVGVSDIITDATTEYLHNLMEGSYPGNSSHSAFSPRNLIEVRASVDEENFNMMKTLYTSCIDEAGLRKLGNAPLVSLLEDYAKNFPLSDADWASNATVSTNDTKAIGDSLLWMARYGTQPLYSTYAGIDDKNPNTRILFVEPQSGQTLPSNDNYDDKAVVALYRDLLKTVLAGVLPSKAAKDQVTKLADEIIALETKLVHALPSQADLVKPALYYTPSDLKTTNALAPELDIERVIRALIPSNYTVNYMITSFPAYLTNVSQILHETPRSGLQAYLMWATVFTSRNLFMSPEADAIRRFRRTLNGQDPDEVPERWRTCLSLVQSNVGWIVGRFYIETAFSQKAKEYGDQMIKDLQAEFIRKFNSSAWMDATTRDRAIQKINKLYPKIGYPTKSPDLTSPESLRDWYAGFVVTPDWLQSNVRYLKWATAKAWARLGQPVDQERWSLLPQDLNAYYSPSANQIVFPAGIMQFPLFDAELPDYVNYGAFGTIVGHEMSHGFDMAGRQYDGDGVLTDWWTNATSAEFNRRAQCFIDEYSNYSVTAPDGTVVHGIGELDLGENIADSGGVEIGYGAWKARDMANPGQKLPGLEHFTNDQMFFLFRTLFFCGESNIEFMIMLMQTDPHPPDPYRSVAPNLNSREFREAYSCTDKNPTCELW